jgi:hypothetical protein
MYKWNTNAILTYGSSIHIINAKISLDFEDIASIFCLSLFLLDLLKTSEM